MKKKEFKQTKLGQYTITTQYINPDTEEVDHVAVVTPSNVYYLYSYDGKKFTAVSKSKNPYDFDPIIEESRK